MPAKLNTCCFRGRECHPFVIEEIMSKLYIDNMRCGPLQGRMTLAGNQLRLVIR